MPKILANYATTILARKKKKGAITIKCLSKVFAFFHNIHTLYSSFFASPVGSG